MDHSKLLEAKAEMQIVCRATRKTVGWIYRWENGECMPLWIDVELDDVEYIPIPENVRKQF